MIDTIQLKLTADDVRGVNFLEETPCYLNDVGVHTYTDDETTITGTVGNLKIYVKKYRLKLENSLCKWYLGDNYKTMRRGDVQCAVERLSDTLHLPVDKATVTRLDVAKNIIVKHPVSVYLNHLGQMKYATRLEQPNSVYYSTSNKCLCIYDKNQEQRAKQEPIPELYQDRNVLRIEQRYRRRVGKQFNVAAVTCAMLYDEQFYIQMVKRWKQAYTDINKINDIIPNFECMRTVKEFKDCAVLAYVEAVGGELAMCSHINEAHKQGKLTNKPAHDLRQTVKSACRLGKGLTVKSEAITELDEKVLKAIRYYR
ncbi:MAG: hypothetical protein LUE27_09490 [Clostridia bacterium]|nr:hypothetical protein [Clostridia bacterium]